MSRVELALRVAGVVGLLTGAVALFWIPRVPLEEAPPNVALAGNQAPGGGIGQGSGTAEIIAGNIFSRTRTAPATRYDPAALEADRYAPAEPIAESEPEPDPESRVPRLFGIIATPAGAAALLQLDPRIPEAQLYREGERAGQYRVVKINEQSVALSGPDGSIVLRLMRPEGQTP